MTDLLISNELDWTAELSGGRSRDEIAAFLLDGPLGAVDRSAGWEVAGEMFEIIRALHDTVIQRLCGVSMLLQSPWERDAAEPAYQDMCGDEVAKALLELRSILNSSLTSEEPTTETCAVTRFVELFDVTAPVVRQRVSGEVPHLTPAVCRVINHTLGESFRNIGKHARPHVVDIELTCERDALELVVSNDGLGAVSGTGAGLGIRLLAMDAATCGGTVTSVGDGNVWTTRVTIPLAA